MDKIAELKQKRTKLMKSIRDLHESTITKRKGDVLYRKGDIVRRKGESGATQDEFASADVIADRDIPRNMTDEERGRYESDRRELDIVNLELQFEERQADLQKEEIRGKLGTVEGASRGPFKSLGEQLMAVRSAFQGKGVDPRFEEVRAAAGATSITDSEGGYLIQKDFSKTIFERAYSIGQILPRVESVPIGDGANGLVMNAFDDADLSGGAIMGGIIAYWDSEAGSVSGTKAKFRQIDLKLQKLHALCYATDELLQDATALQGVVMNGVPKAITLKAEKSIFSGTGAGQCLGFMLSGALIKVAKETGQASSTIVYENCLKMWNRMHADSRANAAWFINQAAEPQLMTMAQIIGVGGVPVWLPAGGASGSPFSTLFGRPVIPVQYCAALGTAGDINFVDLGQYLSINKGPIQAVSSIHVQFLTAETAFRFTYRINGQPLWDKPFTPLANDQTYSPYVTLDNR